MEHGGLSTRNGCLHSRTIALDILSLWSFVWKKSLEIVLTSPPSPLSLAAISSSSLQNNFGLRCHERNLNICTLQALIVSFVFPFPSMTEEIASFVKHWHFHCSSLESFLLSVKPLYQLEHSSRQLLLMSKSQIWPIQTLSERLFFCQFFLEPKAVGIWNLAKNINWKPGLGDIFNIKRICLETVDIIPYQEGK